MEDSTDAVVLSSQNDLTDTGQKKTAYRLAAGILLFSVFTRTLDALVSGGSATTLVFGILIDIGLAIGLIRFSRAARNLVLLRAIIGGIAVPIIALQNNDLVGAIIITVSQVGLVVPELLLLIGETKKWKLWVAGITFLVLNAGLFLLAILFLILGV